MRNPRTLPQITMITDPPSADSNSKSLLAAMDLFWERGYVATSLSDLLQHMQVSRKRIYKVYGSKEALFQAALRTYVEQRAEPGMAALLGKDQGLGPIEQYLRNSSFGPGFRGCLLWNSAAESENLSPASLGIVRAFFERLEGLILENLRAARGRGELHNPAPIQSLAHQVLSLDMGLSVMCKLVHNVQSSHQTVSNLMACLRGTEG